MLHSRRTFLRNSLCASAGATLTFDQLCRTAAAAQVGDDYKALVCVFLDGGNDGDNMLIARGASEYANYAKGRGGLAVARDRLLPITPTVTDGREWGMHPSLPEMATHFAQKKLAILNNVGPLVAPITRAEYLAQSVPVPPQLFSHSDQSLVWQTSLPDQDSQTGWGGRIADLMQSLNTNAKISLAISPTISIDNDAPFLAGSKSVPYQLSTEGSLSLNQYDDSANADPVSQAVREMLLLDHTNLFEGAYRDLTKRAIEHDLKLRGALQSAPPLVTEFPATDLGKQLRMAARMIAVRQAFGVKRQIFFCQLSAFDTHVAQLGTHDGLLEQVSKAMNAFYQATVALGVVTQVTTFTASDFGRTWHFNGSGSDHGWGNHHLILGGAVKGGNLYGRIPVQVEEGPDDSGGGRWIPTTAVDEYAATLALWFGVSVSDLPLVVPNLGRFAKQNLGFMN